MRLILNLIWLILCGWWMALLYVLAGVVCAILIITIPFAIASFRIASYVIWPFGRSVEIRRDAGIASLIGNIIWIVLIGWWLAIGHLTSGYCEGGVIKFVNCSGVKITGCDLYGSGTYGFEFDGCSDIDVDKTTVRDCSYGILRISNSSSVTFTDCKFANNREFDLCTFAGKIEQVMFRKCAFERNFSRDDFFHLGSVTQMGSGVFVWDCAFTDNDCARLQDESGFFSESRNRYIGNAWQAKT